jgi:hypothetical protein
MRAHFNWRQMKEHVQNNEAVACVLPGAGSSGSPTNYNCTANCCVVDSSGSEVFSRVSGEENVIYELTGGGLVVNRLVVCRKGYSDAVCSSTASDTFTRTQYLNFADATYGGLPTNYISLWTDTLGVSDDGSISLAEGGRAPWTASKSYVNPDSFIFSAH